MSKLPIWGTVKQSFGFCFGNLNEIVRLAAMPFCILALLSLITYFLEISLGGDSNLASAMNNSLSFVSIIVMIPFATAWHRKYLLSQKTTNWFSFEFKKREQRYMMVTFMMTAAIIFSVILPIIGAIVAIKKGNSIAIALFVIVFLVVSFLFTRLVMVYPAAAIGASAGLKDSWRATKGSFWRMFTIYLLLGVFLGTLTVAFIFVFGAGSIAMDLTGVKSESSLLLFATLVSIIVMQPLNFIFAAVSVSCLSIIYKFLSEKDDEIQKPVEAAA